MKKKLNTPYFKIGLTAFLVVAACMLFYFLIFHASTVGTGLSKLIGVLNPILYGFVIAYLLNPPFQLIENAFIRIVSKTNWHPKKKGRSVIRIICVFIAAILAILIIYALVALLIPELIKSVRGIIDNLDTYSDNITNWINNTFSDKNLGSQTTATITEITTKLENWFNQNIIPKMDTYISQITSSIWNAVIFFKNAFLGFIISIYVLIEKDYIKARFNRFTYSVWSVPTGNRILHNLRFVDEKFGGFLIGKIIDSAIIGILCYFGMLILRMPYAVLISVIIGVTDIIPFFGPFIGAIPSAFLIFVVDPLQALYFIIFIIVLQQLDGNFITPKILGGSVGISSFLVLISIIIAGGLLGVVGMIIGVPICAIIISLIQDFILKRTEKKQISGDLAPYSNLARINPGTREFVERRPQSSKLSMYDKIKYRSDVVRSYDYPLPNKSWDWTMEDVDERRNLRESDKVEEARWEAESEEERRKHKEKENEHNEKDPGMNGQ